MRAPKPATSAMQHGIDKNKLGAEVLTQLVVDAARVDRTDSQQVITTQQIAGYQRDMAKKNSLEPI